ncbi:hypothetical protein CPLU01_08177 [Colletotrichum plurivorum]|uniref:Uncharacterized protein n=1 Tax=Colletotrichum plurivorum TaxID=2175906 RepID=A0A8H6KDQ0_9PEZI|nr:hypothetical protein CPLU01_08177 [Colletotrichum plurivorum]
MRGAEVQRYRDTFSTEVLPYPDDFSRLVEAPLALLVGASNEYGPMTSQSFTLPLYPDLNFAMTASPCLVTRSSTPCLTTFHLDHTSVPWAVWNPRHTQIITSPIHGAICSGTPVTAAITPYHVSGSHIDIWSPVVPAQLQLPFRQQTLALTLVTILRTPRGRGLVKSKSAGEAPRTILAASRACSLVRYATSACQQSALRKLCPSQARMGRLAIFPPSRRFEGTAWEEGLDGGSLEQLPLHAQPTPQHSIIPSRHRPGQLFFSDQGAQHPPPPPPGACQRTFMENKRMVTKEKRASTNCGELVHLENIPVQEGEEPTLSSWLAATSAYIIMQVREARNQQWQRKTNPQRSSAIPRSTTSIFGVGEPLKNFMSPQGCVRCTLAVFAPEITLIQIVRSCPMSKQQYGAYGTRCDVVPWAKDTIIVARKGSDLVRSRRRDAAGGR